MFMFPPIALHTTVPETFWSWPSMVTFVPPPLGAAVALADAVPDALVADEVVELSDFLLSDEHPDRPAMTIAAPPTATTNPRFTTVLLCLCRDPSRSANHLGQYGAPLTCGHAIERKICLCTTYASTANPIAVALQRQQDTLMANVPEVRKLGLAVLNPSAVPVMS
jgi:hypothetical protein